MLSTGNLAGARSNSVSYTHLDVYKRQALRLRVRKGEAVLSAETVVLSDADAALTRISQSEAGLLESLTLGYPQRRNHEGFAVSWEQKAPDTFLCRVSFYPAVSYTHLAEFESNLADPTSLCGYLRLYRFVLSYIAHLLFSPEEKSKQKSPFRGWRP